MGELLKAAGQWGKNEFPLSERKVRPFSPAPLPQKPQFGRKDRFALMAQFKGVSALPEESPGQIPNPCQGALLPSPINKKQVWKALRS